jgi:hypothetical protein
MPRSAFHDLDKIANLLNIRNMIKTAKMGSEAREFLAEVTTALKEKSARVSPVELAQLVGLAFERTFAGNRKADKMANALARGLSVREQMAAAEGGTMSAEETARYLGVTKQSVLNSYHAGKLLAWRTEKQGALRFPVWQFVDHRRLPGLDELIDKLTATRVLDDWGVAGFFLQNMGLLKDRRPLDLLRENKLEPVLQAAEAYAG